MPISTYVEDFTRWHRRDTKDYWRKYWRKYSWEKIHDLSPSREILRQISCLRFFPGREILRQISCLRLFPGREIWRQIPSVPLVADMKFYVKFCDLGKSRSEYCRQISRLGKKVADMKFDVKFREFGGKSWIFHEIWRQYLGPVCPSRATITNRS